MWGQRADGVACTGNDSLSPGQPFMAWHSLAEERMSGHVQRPSAGCIEVAAACLACAVCWQRCQRTPVCSCNPGCSCARMQWLLLCRAGAKALRGDKEKAAAKKQCSNALQHPYDCGPREREATASRTQHEHSLRQQRSDESLDAALSNLGDAVAAASSSNIQLHKLEHGSLICFAANGVLLCADNPLQNGPAQLVESTARDASQSAGHKQLLHFSPAFVFIAHRQV